MHFKPAVTDLFAQLWEVEDLSPVFTSFLGVFGRHHLLRDISVSLAATY